MAIYVKNGQLRRTVLTVTRSTDGVTDDGYPMVFDIRNNFTWDSVNYPTLSADGAADGLAILDEATYQARLTAFKAYVQDQTKVGSAQMDMVNDVSNPAYETDTDTCPIGQQVN